MPGSEISVGTPPAPDEIEVSLFGPGFGESLAVHFGSGEWGIIDSCRAVGSDGDNAVLAYLEKIKVDPTSAVKLVVLSHWDDDHLSGISDVLQTCGAANFAISSAFEAAEFRAAIAPWMADTNHASSGLKELNQIGPKLRDLRPITASSNKVLYERGSSSPCLVRALSPSDAAVLACVARLRGIDQSRWKGRFPKLEGNDCSVVVSVQALGRSILLGADLEVRANRDYGWLAAVDEHRGAGRDSYTLFKVAHHGSDDGDHEEIWTQMLMSSNPYCILTPFVNGGVKRPQMEDVNRILDRTNRAWATATPLGRKLKGYDRAVERKMNEKARYIEEVPRGFGHLRLRGKASMDASEWTVERFGHAVALDDLRQIFLKRGGKKGA